MRTRLLLPALLVVWACASTNADEEMPAPTPAVDALAAFHLNPGCRIELVAAEPLVASPVAIDFGADGRLWVCEMRDYPMGLDGNWKPGGTIKYLEDTNGDGRYDRATVFLEGLPFPTGVMAWRRGVLVCAAPQILYAEDTDGDGKADLRRTLFEGFATENYQARVNGLSYNLDNWVYGANGLIGGAIRGLASGRTVNIGGRDFRLRPDSGAFEPAAGLTQQGRVHDDWGNQFGGNNSVLIQHYPFPDEYARRNPFVAAPAPVVRVSAQSDAEPLHPTSQTLVRYNHPESANHVTSACSPLIYRDDRLGAEYAGNAFTCEPVHNLVHREVLSAAGVTFRSQRADDEHESEFLSSSDHWFRPVQVRTGPDGALWVVDMYRFVIEHPRWISPERLAQLDVRAGHDRGRIYRVFRADALPRRVSPVDGLSTTALAERLDDPNGTLRDTVQRVLVERGDRAAVPVLTRLAASGTRPVVRAQALWTLAGLGALEPGPLTAALGDRSADVRRQALRIAEVWLGKEEGVTTAALALADDPTLGVRFQAALSIGGWGDPRAAEALARMARGAALDPWLRAALLSALPRHAPRVLNAAVAGNAVDRTLVAGLIATVAGAQDRAAIEAAATALLRAPGKPERWRIDALAALLQAGPDAAFTRTPSFTDFRDIASRLTLDAGASTELRASAVGLLGWIAADLPRDLSQLDALLEPQHPAAVQIAALRVLGRVHSADADAAAIAHWPNLGPSLRQALLDGLLARADSADRLVAALERGTIAAAQIDAAHRQRLLEHPNATLQRRAAAVFAHGQSQSRKQVLDAYRGASERKGDPSRGKAVFRKTCSGCHRYDGDGHEVGPDLAALTDRSPAALLVAVLDPNREVDARYASYTAALKDGRVLTGLMASETGNAITLKRQGAERDVILRADLEDVKTAGQSLMPEGLEHDLEPEDVADLFTYLADSAPRPKVVAGNTPRLVRQDPGGTIRLDAAAAEIFGPSLTFESTFGNLGYWHSAEDHAAWSFRVEQAGTYSVAFEWACDDASAGNAYEVQSGGRTLRGKAGGTGGWSQYRSLFLGELTLAPGVHRLDFRPAGPVRNALLDLRAVVLTPRIDTNAPRPAERGR